MNATAGIDLYDQKYFYTLPPLPSDEKEIIGYNIPKKADQYWRPIDFPDEFQWEKWTTIQQYQYVERERDRLVNGVWFFNNGDPTYITGMHYDHMVNATFDFGKAAYFDSHRLDFYWRDYMAADPMCFGQCVIKPRRYGYSLQEITNQTYVAIMDINLRLGMMSNNKEKTDESLFDPLVQSYLERPEWCRPEIYMPNNKIPKTEIIWNSGVVKKKVGSFKLQGNGLNSKLIPKPTTVMGYDGNKLHYLTMDEAWKWTLADPYASWKKQRPTLVVGTKIIGKASILSTMGDDDDYERAIESGIQMFKDSDPSERDENGHTKCGLYHRFIPGEYALFDFADQYGFMNMDRAANFIEGGRKKYAEGSTDWVYEVRRYPRTLEEAISTSTGIGVFNKKRVTGAITYYMKSPSKTVIGKFEETDLGKKKEQVIWVPGNNGDWELNKTCYPKTTHEKDYSNRWYKDEIDGNLKLLENPQGVLGYDQIRYAEMDTVSKKLSMASIIGFQKFDYYGNGGANKLACLYHQRPDDPEIAHYEAYKAMKFFGFPIAAERQVESTKRRFTELFALATLMISHYDKKLGFWTTIQSKKDGVDLLQAYWKQPVQPQDPDYLMLTPFLPVLNQAKEFTVQQSTKYDVIMSLILAFLGSLQLKETNLSDNRHDDMNAILNMIQPKVR